MSINAPVVTFDVEEMLRRKTQSRPDLIIDGIHFGRGDIYKNASMEIRHTTTGTKCWRIVDDKLEALEEESSNCFYSSETYIIQWDSVTDGNEMRIFFYWSGAKAVKGYSPLPEEVEEDNPLVVRIAQWSEPPAFFRLFSGKFVVHAGEPNNQTNNQEPNQERLYILRGEVEEEAHLFEVPAKRESLRSRTSFALFSPSKKLTIIWHGCRSSSHSRFLIKKVVAEVFNSNVIETDEGSENEEFLEAVPIVNDGYFIDSSRKILDNTSRLFYLCKTEGNYQAFEIECTHRSEYVTPFPFLQSHLYTAMQPAFFLLDDDDQIWLWEGWRANKNDKLKSECFATTITYATEKSKMEEKLMKVQKVRAGFEPLNFTNLFPTWTKREDIVKFQIENGVTPQTELVIKVGPHGIK